MSVDTSIPCSTSQILAISVGDVLSGLRVSESLGETEIDDVDVVLLFANSNKEVVWFYVSM